MDETKLIKEIKRYQGLIKMHEAMLQSSKTKIERSIQRDLVETYEAILSKLLSYKENPRKL